jgi:hypothetical protein
VCALGRPILIRRIGVDPSLRRRARLIWAAGSWSNGSDLSASGQTHRRRANPPWLGGFAKKPRVSLDLQVGPPTVIVFSRIGPVFFVLAQEVKFSLQFSP